ncbi:hypothetical protein JCM24511_09038 [Saitozyma sp. JCM 24511]|nr:hypothetical protein JCM24511_09038 [Saitozyma sp. JCM 24511]
MSSPQILILGAAGYIGGTVLVDLLKSHPARNITALVRTDGKQSLLAPLGVNTVIGSVDDTALLSSLVSKADVVFNFAVPFFGGDAAMQTIVNALEVRARTSAVKPVLLQTSGSGSIMYGSDGVAGDDVWKDTDYDRWESLPDSAFFHSGDKILAAAAERGIISAYIVMSPTVYGPGLGPGNKLSLQMPAYVRYAKRTGQAAYIGKGENIWGNVHVSDLSALYLILMTHALTSPGSTAATPGSHGWSNLIYAGLGQHTWKPIVSLIGDQLAARGDIPHTGAVSIPEGSGDMYMFGGNSFMAVSEKAKALGWRQVQPDLEEAVKLALPK